MAEPLVLINVFEVPAGEAEQFIAAWEKMRDYLKSQPGYIDTALHQAIAPDADFQFVNVAHWRTAEEFLAATQTPEFLDSAVGLVHGPGVFVLCSGVFSVSGSDVSVEGEDALVVAAVPAAGMGDVGVPGMPERAGDQVAYGGEGVRLVPGADLCWSSPNVLSRT